ncbi:DNA RNA non-specific endonuclease, putative [Bodo saltans]|uniref:DNA RNA non-specific endonuclease, putative n=1 Tax=Bodo saltans TaxID=75058 RepID=A0A0S4J808_BODSA|nr:DNA RNA non-specific endonuclease, putative [Bodo saltans]|eukprot:CUG87638.1 DNA RNA non-specific endonuclease, putative [Bodo saltans]
MLGSPIAAATRSLDDSVFRPLHQASLGIRPWLTLPVTIIPSSTKNMEHFFSPSSLSSSLSPPRNRWWVNAEDAASTVSSHPASLPTSTTFSLPPSHNNGAMMTAATLFAVGVTIGFGCGIYAKHATRWVTRWRSDRALAQLRRQLPHSTFSPAVTSDLSRSLLLQELQRTGYTAVYSRVLRSPAWVTYLVTPQTSTFAAQVDRSNMFIADKDVPKEDRWTALDVRSQAAGGGYDRGHLAPHGAVGCCETSSAESFLLSNIALQHPKLNRRSWKQLEMAVTKHVETQFRACQASNMSTTTIKKKTSSSMMSVAAVTVGPLFGPKAVTSATTMTTKKEISSASLVNEVRIPEAFFMAVFDTQTGCTAAFVATNDARALVTAMPLTHLEQRLGKEYGGCGIVGEAAAQPIRLFSQYRDEEDDTVLSAVARSGNNISRTIKTVRRRVTRILHQRLPLCVLKATGASAAVVHARHCGVARIDAAATSELHLPTGSSSSLAHRAVAAGSPKALLRRRGRGGRSSIGTKKNLARLSKANTCMSKLGNE